MTQRVLNTSGGRVGYLAVDLSDGETSGVFVLRIVPASGYFLKAVPADADFEIQARETGSGDPFVDIAAAPIDLSSYAAETPVNFDFRVVAGSPLVDVRRAVASIAIASQEAAGWAD